MTASRTVRPQTASAEMPPVPLTIEGYSVLHQMMRFRWSAWRQLGSAPKKEIAQEASHLLGRWEQGKSGQSAVYSLIVHKGDLMLVHLRSSFAALKRAETHLAQ